MTFSRSRKLNTGFTLIEAIVALVVAGVLLGIAVPSMRNFLQDSRMTSYTNDLVASLSFARSEAIKRGTTLSLCPSNDGTSCSNSDWDLGWIVFTDGGVVGTVDAGDTILRVQQALDGRLTLTGPNSLSYQGSGMLVSACESCIDEPASGNTWLGSENIVGIGANK